MTKFQIGTALAGVVLFLGLYFGFDTKPSKLPQAAAQPAGTTGETVMEMAKQRLSKEAAADLSKLESDIENAPETGKTASMKRISGWWYATGNISAAAIWAEKAAAIENSDTAWQVAGATFYEALVGTEAPVLRQFCGEHAVKAFENAAAINPAKVEHRVNLALVYAENPPPDNPMKAVLMLKDLESRYPENASVYNALGRLAIKTGQWQKAIERLEKAWALDPDNRNTPCLLATAYKGAGNLVKAKEFDVKCR